MPGYQCVLLGGLVKLTAEEMARRSPPKELQKDTFTHPLLSSFKVHCETCTSKQMRGLQEGKELVEECESCKYIVKRCIINFILIPKTW